MTENRFYVYLDPRKSGVYKYGEHEFSAEPFYVGKGTNKRILLNCHKRSKHLINKINKIKDVFGKPVVMKIIEDVSEQEAFGLEIKLIKSIGRKQDGGPLVNFTLGGEGSSGNTLSDSTIAKIVASNVKTRSNPSYVSPLKDKKLTKKHIKNRDASRKKTTSNPDYVNPNKGRKKSKESVLRGVEKRKETVSKPSYINPCKGRKRPPEVVSKARATLIKTLNGVGYVNPNTGRKNSKESIEKQKATKKINRELKIQELYQSIINLIIRKELLT